MKKQVRVSEEELEKIINQVRWMKGKEAIMGEKINSAETSRCLAHAIAEHINGRGKE